MNKIRRTKIFKLINDLDTISAIASDILDEETDAYDNLPDGIVDSDRGARIKESVDSLSYALDSLEDAVDYFNDAIN